MFLRQVARSWRAEEVWTLVQGEEQDYEAEVKRNGVQGSTAIQPLAQQGVNCYLSIRCKC